MGIAVKCPNGHSFSVKDKYAGKKGLCPFCPGQVAVRVPDATNSDALKTAAMRAVREEHGGSLTSSVFDDEEAHVAEEGGSMLGSSVIRHHIKCKCGNSVPMWFAKCPKCGTFLEQW